MTDPRRAFGNEGENAAADFLQAKGLHIIERQHRTPFGEIDLIALAEDEVVFVEVKARQDLSFGYPEEQVSPAKLRRIALGAEAYLESRQWEARPFRIDIVAILWKEGHTPEIEHFPAVDIPSGRW